MPAKRARRASTRNGRILKKEASSKIRPSNNTRQQELQQDPKKKKKAKPKPESPVSLSKKLDPVAVLPLEVIGLILEMRYCYEENMRAIIALERVSKGWASAIRATCTPAWCESKGFDWCGMSEDLVAGRVGWGSIKAEVKRYYNMTHGLPTAGIAGDWAGPTLLREDYFACLEHDTKGPKTLMIRRKDPKKVEEGLPIHEQFGEAMYFDWKDILCFRGRPLSGELFDEELWNITFFGSSPESIILLLEHVRCQITRKAPVVGGINGQRLEKIFACISTRTGHLLWVRPVDPRAAKFDLPANANPNSASITDFTRIVPPQGLNEEREVLRRRKYLNNIPHTTTHFFSYITCTSAGVMDTGVDLTQPRRPIAINTIDLRTGQILDNLRHTIPDVFNCFSTEVVHLLDARLLPLSTLESDHLRLIIHQTAKDRSWTASIHNLATKTQLTSVTLPRPAIDDYILAGSPEPIPTSSFQTAFDNFEVSIHPVINHPGRYSIIATVERVNTESPLFRHNHPSSSFHISWTLTLDLSDSRLPTLSLREVNYYYAKDYPFVRLNSRSRVGATTHGPKHDRTTVVSIINYLEMRLREGSDDVVLGETRFKLRFWMGHWIMPQPLMLLPPVPPKRRTKKAIMREEEIADIARREGWYAGERSSREVFRAAYLEKGGVLNVRDGVLVLKGTVFWF